jgi:hypothetical protein
MPSLRESRAQDSQTNHSATANSRVFRMEGTKGGRQIGNLQCIFQKGAKNSEDTTDGVAGAFKFIRRYMTLLAGSIAS